MWACVKYIHFYILILHFSNLQLFASLLLNCTHVLCLNRETEVKNRLSLHQIRANPCLITWEVLLSFLSPLLCLEAKKNYNKLSFPQEELGRFCLARLTSLYVYEDSTYMMGSPIASFAGQRPLCLLWASPKEPSTGTWPMWHITIHRERPIRSVCLGFLSSNFCQIKELLFSSVGRDKHLQRQTVPHILHT